MAKKEEIMEALENKIVRGNGITNYSAQKYMYAKSSHEYVVRDISDIRNNYIRLGFHLDECRNYGYYECFGYVDFYDYVKANFGLEKSAVSRCINVFLTFSKMQNNTHTMFLDDKWKDFSYSQLTEMLTLDDETRKKISPDMTVASIREFKKSKRKCKRKTDSSITVIDSKFTDEVATSQPEEELSEEEIQRLINYSNGLIANRSRFSRMTFVDLTSL